MLVKTYSDLLVLWQYTNEKLVEPLRWFLYALSSWTTKSPFPAVDKARSGDCNKLYSIIDRFNMSDLPLRKSRIHESTSSSHDSLLGGSRYHTVQMESTVVKSR